MRRLSIGILLLMLSMGLASAGLVQMNVVPRVFVHPFHDHTDGDIYYLESYPGAGSYDIDSRWFQAGLWNTNAISVPYVLEQISWYGYSYYSQDFEYYIAPEIDGEPGPVTYVGTSYDNNIGIATWHTHVLDTPYPVLPDENYYLIFRPVSYIGSGYWWCSDIESVNPHASLTSEDFSTWTVDYQQNGFEYLPAIWAEGEEGHGRICQYTENYTLNWSESGEAEITRMYTADPDYIEEVQCDFVVGDQAANVTVINDWPGGVLTQDITLFYCDTQYEKRCSVEGIDFGYLEPGDYMLVVIDVVPSKFSKPLCNLDWFTEVFADGALWDIGGLGELAPGEDDGPETDCDCISFTKGIASMGAR